MTPGTKIHSVPASSAEPNEQKSSTPAQMQGLLQGARYVKSTDEHCVSDTWKRFGWSPLPNLRRMA